jgi:hypothetical protein
MTYVSIYPVTTMPKQSCPEIRSGVCVLTFSFRVGKLLWSWKKTQYSMFLFYSSGTSQQNNGMNKKRSMYSILGVIVLFLITAIASPDVKYELRTEHFSFSVQGNINSEALNDLARALENSYPKIGKNLNTVPADTIEVHIYSSRWRYIYATGNWTASGNIEGTSKIHFVEQSWSETDSKKVAVHEFTHTVVLKLLVDREAQPLNAAAFDEKFSAYPVWLWEAISVYEAGQFVDPASLPYLTNGSHPSLSELSNRAKGGKIYNVGYTIIEYILHTYGHDKYIEIIGSYGDVQKVFHVSEEEFCNNWYDYVKNKYLK